VFRVGWPQSSHDLVPLPRREERRQDARRANDGVARVREAGQHRDQHDARGRAAGQIAPVACAWDAYWESLPCRHALFTSEARDYVDRLAAVVPLDTDLQVLDFGCGSGLAAALLATRVGAIAAWDRSPAMRRLAARHLHGVANAAMVDLTSDGPPAAARYDLILVNSVLQYMRPAQVAVWLPLWRSLLARSGQVVVSDIVPDASGRFERLREAVDVLAFHARRGALCRAASERLSDLGRYWRAARAEPLTRFDRDTLYRIATAAGFRAEFLPGSLTCRPRRLTMLLN
jgi:trans-aconitate methyltransferase